MDVRVQVNGVDHPIPDPSDHPVLCGPVSCLRAVRAIQSGSAFTPTLFAVDVVEIKRYNEVLGHLALTKYPAPRETAAEQPPSRAVTLMRNGAELVVRQLERSPLTEPGIQWAGVFKPVAALDPTFASSTTCARRLVPGFLARQDPAQSSEVSHPAHPGSCGQVHRAVQRDSVGAVISFFCLSRRHVGRPNERLCGLRADVFHRFKAKWRQEPDRQSISAVGRAPVD